MNWCSRLLKTTFSCGLGASQKRPFLRALKPRILEGDGAALIVIGHIRNGAGDAGRSSDRQLFDCELVFSAGMDGDFSGLHVDPVTRLETFIDRQHFAADRQSFVDVKIVGPNSVVLRRLADLRALLQS